MFEWLRRVLQQFSGDERQSFFETVDALNSQFGGGQPTVTTELLGNLRLRSGTLALADPQYVPGLEVCNIAAREVQILAKLWRYPTGIACVAALTVRLGDESDGDSWRRIGEVAIDSAKLVIADKADIEEHWTEVGRDRIGVISTAPDDTVLRMLAKRFDLDTVQINAVRAEVVGPVSEQLEEEIEIYLKSRTKYSQFPFLYFYVETNSSFDRANDIEKAWDFIPIGNENTPLMLVCGTGRGDGVYDVRCAFSGEIPRTLSITFIGD
jgi:hypothetical protein